MILVTGGTGKTGSRVARRLVEHGVAARIASRSGEGTKAQEGVKFDWHEAATYREALRNVTTIYLVAPTDTTDSLGAMLPFLKEALRTGVSRFVLLSASSLEKGGPMMGRVHTWLSANAPDWTVLRPTWFMQNFSEQHLFTIRDESTLYTATEDGRVPFIDADDIAAAAQTVLLAPEAYNRDFLLTGPEVLSYDDVAEILTEVTGRPITHTRLSERDLRLRFQALGIEADYAASLAAMDSAIAQGAEDRLSDAVLTLSGEAPERFARFAANNAWRWTA